MIKDLYTPKDVKEIREQFLKVQGNFDPVLFQPLKASDSCLDHDHTSQLCRGALHKQSNTFEGLVFNAYKRCISWLSDDSLPSVLRRLASYLESQPAIKAYHPAWIKRVVVDFKKLPVKKQNLILVRIGLTPESNAVKRVKQFKAGIMKRNIGYELAKEITSAEEKRE